ncbi:hypothetical protein [Salinibaculum rarum]|uniref:hypothetical protein n=1 Tax=Salinibaculum rarum TaxID=3058903 RepID=UPI00265F3DA4|nr:hypothetical protein [Salinibaculum sp. KK48]
MSSHDAELPSYSLLQSHETIVTYALPDPEDDTGGYLLLELFSWELVDENQSGTSEFRVDEPNRDGKVYDGIGFTLSITNPGDVRDNPPHLKDWVRKEYDTHSCGGGKDGHTFRLQNTTPEEIRALVQTVAQYVFSYWWALRQTDDYNPTLKRKESYRSRRHRLDIVDDVRPDGTIIYNDGSTSDGPYALSDIDLLPKADWDSPEERAEAMLADTLEDLRDEYGYYTVQQALRNVEVKKPEALETTKTDALKAQEELEAALRKVDPDGVGHRICRGITNRFDTVEELVTDIETGGSELRDIRAVGESTFKNIERAFAEYDYL